MIESLANKERLQATKFNQIEFTTLENKMAKNTK